MRGAGHRILAAVEREIARNEVHGVTGGAVTITARPANAISAGMSGRRARTCALIFHHHQQRFRLPHFLRLHAQQRREARRFGDFCGGLAGNLGTSLPVRSSRLTNSSPPAEPKRISFSAGLTALNISAPPPACRGRKDRPHAPG